MIDATLSLRVVTRILLPCAPYFRGVSNLSHTNSLLGIACSGWLKVHCKGIMLVIPAVQTIVAWTNKLLQKRKSAVKEGWLRQCISHGFCLDSRHG